ncbi:MAG: GHKL domain-containing protein, partial [archaeon]|nr:GHKL domain-containing protein [archaeon]
ELQQFAYVASHDLSSPLLTVASYLELLEGRYSEKLDERGLKYIDRALNAAKHMNSLINDLLTYSRVGTRGLKFKSINCTNILSQVIDNLGHSIKENKALITFDPLPVVKADSIQLNQLFQNLVANAIKFHGKGNTPQVHIGVTEKNDEWVFFVQDNGIGIDIKHFDKIFTIFQRLHSTTEYSGTGIGLSICKRIIERHGGRIWVESEVGIGTTFYFTLPKIK